MQMREKIGRINGVTVLRHDHNTDPFAQTFVLYCDRSCPRHTGMAHRQRFDLRRMDVVASSNDDVFNTPGYLQIAVLVDPTKVLCHEPTALVESGFCGQLIVEIAEHQTCAATSNVSDFSGRERPVWIF